MSIFKKLRKRFSPDLQHAVSTGDSIARLKRHGLNISTFISIGAGSGIDTVWIHQNLCPDSNLLMIEAQEGHRQELEKLRAADNRRDYVICAAAAQDGEVSFLASASTGGVISSSSKDSITIPARSIDSLLDERRLKGHYFLKFDTHGVETDILDGARATLRSTELIMMECYNFKLNFVDGRNLTFGEMCAYMLERGFRCVDMSDPLFRPGDLAFWQIHLYFIRADHKIFNSNSFSASLKS